MNVCPTGSTAPKMFTGGFFGSHSQSRCVIAIGVMSTNRESLRSPLLKAVSNSPVGAAMEALRTTEAVFQTKILLRPEIWIDWYNHLAIYARSLSNKKQVDLLGSSNGWRLSALLQSSGIPWSYLVFMWLLCWDLEIAEAKTEHLFSIRFMARLSWSFNLSIWSDAFHLWNMEGAQ